MTLETSQQNTTVPTKIQLSITGDKTIEADLKTIPLSKLILDPANVRFKHIAEPMSDEQIEDWSQKTNIHTLYHKLMIIFQ